ncbi:NADH-quinone oxidoreductase subunit A, partial [Verrucomicrobiales bacterium]|nr:NADH-quinone oxidoreductase subunit A [Verrucomicrobiales bacterium]
MSSDYLPILIQILIAGGFAAVTLLISVVLGKSAQRSEVKDSAYECGMLPIGETQPRFSVKFYLVAMLFVIFDIEVVFMYPWAVTFQELVVRDGVTIAFWSALSFVGIL